MSTKSSRVVGSSLIPASSSSSPLSAVGTLDDDNNNNEIRNRNVTPVVSKGSIHANVNPNEEDQLLSNTRSCSTSFSSSSSSDDDDDDPPSISNRNSIQNDQHASSGTGYIGPSRSSRSSRSSSDHHHHQDQGLNQRGPIQQLIQPRQQQQAKTASLYPPPRATTSSRSNRLPAGRSKRLPGRSKSLDDSSNMIRNGACKTRRSPKASSSVGSRAPAARKQRIRNNSQDITPKTTNTMEMVSGGCTVNPITTNGPTEDLLEELVNCGKIHLRQGNNNIGKQLDDHHQEQFAEATIPSEKMQEISERHHVVETILAASMRDSVSSSVLQGEKSNVVGMHASNKTRTISEKGHDYHDYDSSSGGMANNQAPSTQHRPSDMFHYTDHGAVCKDSPLPEGVDRPGAYAGTMGQDYERLSSLHLTVSTYSPNNNNTAADMEPVNLHTGEEQMIDDSSDSESEAASQEEVANHPCNDEEAAIEDVKTPASTERRPATPGPLLMVLGVVIVIIIVVVVVVVVVLVTGGESGGDSLPESSGETDNPVGDGDQMAVDFNLLPDLPEATLDQLRDPTTPQSLAMVWLSQDPNRDVYPEWQKLQRFALATFFYAMGGKSWPTTNEQAKDWMNYSIPECDWFPYEDACTENGKVIWLQFSHLPGFRGSLPPEIQFLDQLSGIDFSNNLLGVPLEVMLPLHTIAMSSSLTRIQCASCQLSGSFPSELGMVTNLQFLELTGNTLTGSLPSEVGRLTSLTQLLLESNELVGDIPSQVGLLTGLTDLALMDNTISGSIPTEIGNLSNLQWLGIDYNMLTGTLPTTLGLLTNILRMEFEGNKLSGGLPSELGLLSIMSTLDLFNNRLEGTIPTQLGTMASLKWVGLARNALSGQVPTECGHMTSVTNFDLALNQLTGTVPSELGLLTQMTLLSLEHNVITGTVPTEIKALTNLKTLLV